MVHLCQWFWNWFAVHTGTYNESGPYYGFFSGFGSDIGEITLIGLVLNWYRIHKCVSCFRLSKHDVKGTHYATCHVHLPDHDKIRAEHKKKFPLQHKILNQ